MQAVSKHRERRIDKAKAHSRTRAEIENSRKSEALLFEHLESLAWDYQGYYSLITHSRCTSFSLRTPQLFDLSLITTEQTRISNITGDRYSRLLSLEFNNSKHKLFLSFSLESRFMHRSSATSLLSRSESPTKCSGMKGLNSYEYNHNLIDDRNSSSNAHITLSLLRKSRPP